MSSVGVSSHSVTVSWRLFPSSRSIYGTTRSAVELLSNNSDSRYSGVVLIDWPRPGIKSIGLVTSRMVDTNGEEMLAVYIPTTPIPSSGFWSW